MGLDSDYHPGEKAVESEDRIHSESAPLRNYDFADEDDADLGAPNESGNDDSYTYAF